MRRPKLIAEVSQLVLLVAAVLSSCLPAGPARENRLRDLMGEMPQSGLSLESKKRAHDYGASWMKAFETLGTSGLAREGVVDDAYVKELLPFIAPFETGTAAEQHAFKLGDKVYRVMAYVGEQTRTKGNWPDAELNGLLRISPQGGAVPGAPELSEGVGEVLFDYVQIIDPLSFEAARMLMKVKR
jgi:hypothetical protein